MALVPSSGTVLSVPTLSSSLAALRSAFADRRLLDSAISAQDAADWQEILGPTAASSSAKPALRLAGRASSGGRGRGTGPGDMVNSRDLKIKPPTTKIPSGVPRNFLSSISFDRCSNKLTFNTSATVLSENNYSFNLTTNPQYASYANLFDQWCIVMASATFFSSQAPGSSSTEIELHTAIDFDSTTALGSVGAIDQFDNVNVDILGPGNKRRITRSCKPSVKTSTSGGSTSSGLLRQWCDTTSPNTTWFGIRSICPATTTVLPVTVELSVWYAFRGRY